MKKVTDLDKIQFILADAQDDDVILNPRVVTLNDKDCDALDKEDVIICGEDDVVYRTRSKSFIGDDKVLTMAHPISNGKFLVYEYYC